MSLDQYLKIFTRLWTDKNRKRWSALTTHQAPKKYIFADERVIANSGGEVKLQRPER